MKPHIIVLCTVLAGQMILAYQMRSWRSLFEMLLLDILFAIIYLFAVATLI